jgi:hypothetical protein
MLPQAMLMVVKLEAACIVTVKSKPTNAVIGKNCDDRASLTAPPYEHYARAMSCSCSFVNMR